MSARAAAAKAPKPAVSFERKRLLGLVHQLKSRLRLDDATYRDKMAGHTGKRSAADLSDIELRDLLAAWSRALPEDERGAFTGGRAPSTLTEPFQRLVRALWISLYHLAGVTDGSDAALDKFVARQAKVTALRFLRAGAAPGVVEALKDMLAKEGAQLPAKIVGNEGRQAVVRAQWSKLHKLGAVTVPFEDALTSWMHGPIVPGRRPLSQLTSDQLDQAITKLGDWIRLTLRKKAAAS
ncbi:hypothetical protein sos41_31520 [Alphaproteobacteria bacterium SO-S41]|nr:hypothetical protein sos41_31520 [Alphaproteobacteria bacterium SO-S41]